MYVPSEFCRLEACWLDTLADDQMPIPLDRPFAFNILKPAEGPAAAADASVSAGATQSSGCVAVLDEADIASGRRWSVRVVPYSGIPDHALNMPDAKYFQVRGSRCTVIGAVGCCDLYLMKFPSGTPHGQVGQDVRACIHTCKHTFVSIYPSIRACVRANVHTYRRDRRTNIY